jgi:hypothetical protein
MLTIRNIFDASWISSATYYQGALAQALTAAEPLPVLVTL